MLTSLRNFRRLAALALIAAAFDAVAQPGATEDAALDVPALETRGTTIRAVNIQIDNVFDTSNPEEDKRLYRWANRVHRTTRPHVVEDILLFEPGDNLEQRLLDESARLLRARGFVADSTVSAQSYDEETNTAAVNVWVRDSWSLEPDLKLSRSGGKNEYGIGITDDNLFGLGKTLTLAYSSEIDRDERRFGYSDSNVAGSRVGFGIGLADTSDGHRIDVAGGRPFFALDSRWSIQTRALDDERVDSIYDLGEVIDEFRHDVQAFSLQGGLSRGIMDGTARRWLAGISYEEDRFQPSSRVPNPALLPEDRKLVYPWVGLQIIEDDFRQVTELNDMGRTEDIALGLDLFASVGFATRGLGSDRDATIVSFSATRGWEPGGPGHLFLLQTSATARKERTGVQNSIVTIGAQYYRRNFGSGLLSASLATVLANRLDAETQVLLGGDNGMRGYPIRYQSGERSAILTVEQRFFTDWYPFRLIRVGYAFFLDVGRVWSDDLRATPKLGTLYDVGVGLRLTSPRSSSRSVVHVDLAFPVNAPNDIDSVQLNVEKKASF